MPEYPDMRKAENKTLMTTIRERYRLMYDADHTNRQWAMEDMKFVTVPSEQWDSNMLQERGKRPCYEYNKLRQASKRIINNMRSNRPGVKVRPTEDTDKDGAEIREGLIRNIWQASNADAVIDYEAEYQVNGGMCAWRVDTKYATDDNFDQDIVIEAFENPFTVYVDPACKDKMKRDADDWAITTRMSNKAFEASWPGAAKTDFQGDQDFDDDEDWADEDTVRVVEYWYKTPTEKELYKLDSGEIVDSETDEGLAIATSEPDSIQSRRTVKTHKIQYCIASGHRVLEGPHDWAGRVFPFIMVYGEYIVIDGKPYWCGNVRYAKDAQRSYNVSRTAITETIAQAPLTKWWATVDQASGLEKQWAEAHKKNFPWMVYNTDPKAPGPPARMGGAEVPQALIAEAQLASDEIKAVTGIYDASMGARSNETSGRAIYARQNEGEISTYNFPANMENGVQLTYEIIMDLIPEIYDTERELRVLGEDGAEKYYQVNRTTVDYSDGTPKEVRVHDLSAGKYDVTVTSGPSFATKRQEASELYFNIMQSTPDILGVAGDLIFKALDFPYSEKIAERLRYMLPPAIQQSLSEDMPPEVAQVMAQAEAAMEQAQNLMQEAGQQKAEADAAIAKADKAGANVGKEMAEVRAAKAEFQRAVSEELRKLAELKAEIAPSVAIADRSDEAAEKVEEMRETVEKIDDIVALFMQQTDRVVDQVETSATRRIVAGSVRRKDGLLEADVQYDDGSERKIQAERSNGELRMLPEAGPAPEDG